VNFEADKREANEMSEREREGNGGGRVAGEQVK